MHRRYLHIAEGVERVDWEFVTYPFKIRKNSRILPTFKNKIGKISLLHISIKHKAINVTVAPTWFDWDLLM